MKKLNLICLVITLLPILGMTQIPNPNYILAFEDNFNDNSVDTNLWYYRDIIGTFNGGYNKEENVSEETQNGIGYLRIDYNQWDANNDGDATDIVGGGVMYKKALGYGYYETKILFYNGSRGFHQSFWNHGLGSWSSYSNKYTYIEDAKNDIVPLVNQLLEIDAIELDSDFNVGGTNYHWNKPTSNTPPEAGRPFESSYIDTNNWITIGFEWKPGVISYFVDGVLRNRYYYIDDRYAAQEVWISGLANDTGHFGGGGIPLPDAHMKVDYFRYYTADFVSNLVGNSSFENNGNSSGAPFNWVQNDNVYDNIYSDGAEVIHNGTAYDGDGHYRYNCITGEIMSNKQTIYGIANGQYKLKAWVKSSGGLNTSRMRAIAPGSPEIIEEIPQTNEWTEIIIDNITVNNRECTIAFTTAGNNGQWVEVDKVEFINKTTTGFEVCDDLIVDNGDDGYQENGTGWATSGLKGFLDSDTKYHGASTPSPSATWAPKFLLAGEYEVFVYKIAHSSSDPNAKIDIVHNGGTTTRYLDFTVGDSGWTSVGIYNFNAGLGGSVTNTLNSAANIRVDSVKFVNVDCQPKLSNDSDCCNGDEPSVLIYPNPIKEVLSLNKVGKYKSIKIYDLAGKLIGSESLNGDAHKMDMSQFSSGLYLYVLDHKASGKSIFGKLLKE